MVTLSLQVLVKKKKKKNQTPAASTQCCCQSPPKHQKVEHIPPVLKSLHVLPVSQEVDFKIILLVYKGLNVLGPKHIQTLQVLWDRVTQ